MKNKAEEIIQALHLEPHHGEGGWFFESYRSSVAVDHRCCGTSIYYLLRNHDRSCWHKVDSDEIWLYHGGAPALQYLIYPDGTLDKRIIGMEIGLGMRPQSIIPAGVWQTAALLPAADAPWGLFGAVVFPGFEMQDFTAATDEEIAAMFPNLEAFPVTI